MPKVNEVWRTKSGRLALIVYDGTGAFQKPLMLWYDDIDRDFNVGEIMDRLSYKENMSKLEWFNHIMGEMIRNND